MKMRALSFLIAMTLPAFPLQAQTANVCMNERQNFQRHLAIIETIVSRIETVPPNDAEWLKTELDETLRQGNDARFKLLIKHQYYPAFEVHKTMHKFQEALKIFRSMTYSNREQALGLVESLSIIADLQGALDSYIDRDLSRASPVLTKNWRGEIYEELPFAKAITALLIKCLVRAI